MSISAERMDRMLLQQAFSIANGTMPNAAIVLKVLGDDAFTSYSQAQQIMRDLWRATGQDPSSLRSVPQGGDHQ